MNTNSGHVKSHGRRGVEKVRKINKATSVPLHTNEAINKLQSTIQCHFFKRTNKFCRTINNNKNWRRTKFGSSKSGAEQNILNVEQNKKKNFYLLCSDFLTI